MEFLPVRNHFMNSMTYIVYSSEVNYCILIDCGEFETLQDDTELIKRTPSMVEIGELNQFLMEVAKIRRKYHVRDFADFFLKCYDSLTGAYKDELKRILKEMKIFW